MIVTVPCLFVPEYAPVPSEIEAAVADAEKAELALGSRRAPPTGDAPGRSDLTRNCYADST